MSFKSFLLGCRTGGTAVEWAVEQHVERFFPGGTAVDRGVDRTFVVYNSLERCVERAAERSFAVFRGLWVVCATSKGPIE